MKVRIIQDFTGYPDGTDKSKTFYSTGQTPDLPDDFAVLIKGKGHAVDPDAPQPVPSPAASKPPPAPTAAIHPSPKP